MTEIIKGTFCESVAGHDAGSIYVIIGKSDALYVCDRKLKTIESPKRKNRRHVRILNYRDEMLQNKIEQNRVNNEDIKYSIKNYLIHIRNVD